MSKTTLADIERLCWHLSGWQVDQRSVDALLKAVAEYAGYGPDEGGVTALASPLGLEGGAGGVVRPSEPLAAPPASEDTPEPRSGAHSGVQRIEVTGTLSLVCPGVCGGPASVPAPVVAVPKVRKVIPLDPDERVRRCSKCQRTLSVSEFARDSKGRGGRRYACRECENTRKREAKRAQRVAAQAV